MFCRQLNSALIHPLVCVQLLYPFLKAAAAVEGAREDGGSSVVNISSVAGLTAIKSGT